MDIYSGLMGDTKAHRLYCVKIYHHIAYVPWKPKKHIIVVLLQLCAYQWLEGFIFHTCVNIA